MSEASRDLTAFLSLRADPRRVGGLAVRPPVPGALEPQPRMFSPFSPADMDSVAEILVQFNLDMNAAGETEAGLARVAERARSLLPVKGLEAVQHALAIFAAHAGKQRPGAPRIAIPPQAFLADDQAGVRALGLEPAAPAPEHPSDRLHWFREDLFLNEHHRHWHIVYPTTGVPLADGTVRTKERQGEIFVYMHQQMLARYDTECLAAGIGKVEPLEDLSLPIDRGYDPNARPPSNIGYVARPDGARVPPPQAEDIRTRRQVFLDMLASGTVSGRPVELTPNLVGALLESNLSAFGPSSADLDEWRARRQFLTAGGFQLHNFGHGAIASTPEPGQHVMNNPHTSLQDPVFWRWHRMIDDLAQRHAAALPPHQPARQGDTLLRDGTGDGDSPDLLVLSETQLRAEGIDLDAPDRAAPLAALVDRLFGAGRWDDPAAPAGAAAQLRTGTLLNRFVYQREAIDGGPPISLDFQREHLISERFVTIVRAQSDSAEARPATLRLFLCAEAFLGEGATADQEHRFWIELDRRPVTLAPGRNLFHCVSDESAVVRKLRGRAPFPTAAFTQDDFGDLHSGDDPVDDYCDCGWPLNLLLPRGTPDGMAFRLMAMISDGAPGAARGQCGSRAFCGAGFDAYPELPGIAMGYPFDRPAPGGTLGLIAAARDMASRRIVIRHDPGLAAAFGLVPDA